MTSNLPAAIKIANAFSHSSHEIEDLVSVGAETLMRACDGYDCSRPTPFLAYAMRSLASNYGQYQRGMRRPRPAKLLEEAAFAEPSDTRANPWLVDRNHQTLVQSLEKILDGLNERERIALIMRELEDQTFATIGDKFGISKQGAQGIVRRAIANAQQQPTIDPLDNFL